MGDKSEWYFSLDRQKLFWQKVYPYKNKWSNFWAVKISLKPNKIESNSFAPERKKLPKREEISSRQAASVTFSFFERLRRKSFQVQNEKQELKWIFWLLAKKAPKHSPDASFKTVCCSWTKAESWAISLFTKIEEEAKSKNQPSSKFGFLFLLSWLLRLRLFRRARRRAKSSWSSSRAPASSPGWRRKTSLKFGDRKLRLLFSEQRLGLINRVFESLCHQQSRFLLSSWSKVS